MIRILSLCLFLIHSIQCISQETKKPKDPITAHGNLNITDNGLSLFPNLSLGKPATIINLAVGNSKLAFEPELRWGLNGKPWSYIFWFRYRFNTPKFQLRVGAHPAYILNEQQVQISNGPETRFIATRYFAAEVSPMLKISPKVQVAVHLLRGVASDDYGVPFSNFISLQPRFMQLGLGKNFYFDFFPQVFFLQLDNVSGTYFSETLTFNKRDFPIYLSHTMTYAIKSNISGDPFVSSFGLNIRF